MTTDKPVFQTAEDSYSYQGREIVDLIKNSRRHFIIRRSTHLQPRRLDDNIEKQGPFIQHEPLCTPGMDRHKNEGIIRHRHSLDFPSSSTTCSSSVRQPGVSPASEIFMSKVRNGRACILRMCVRTAVGIPIQDSRIQTTPCRIVDVHPSNNCTEKTRGGTKPVLLESTTKRGSWYKEPGESPFVS